MPGPISQSTFEEFRSAAAGGEPMPAAVAIAAASASFALGLLAKVAKVTSRHKKVGEHAAKLISLADRAVAESERMLDFAERDVEAFKAYIESSRLPQSNAIEREFRQRAVDDAARKAIEIPVAAARAAAHGLEMCSDALVAPHAAVVADLGAAASLLASAMRIFLTCADSNLRQMAVDPARFAEALVSRTEWEARAIRDAEAVEKHVACTLSSLPGSSTKRP